MPIGDYCRTSPATAQPEESIRQAAQRMESLGVGSLVVVDAERRPLGMITDRDLVLRVLRQGCDAETTPVGEVMRRPALMVTQKAPVAVAGRFMRRCGLRRLPIVDDEGRLAGIVAVDDLLQLLSSELAAAATTVRSQFPADLEGGHALAAETGGES